MYLSYCYCMGQTIILFSNVSFWYNFYTVTVDIQWSVFRSRDFYRHLDRLMAAFNSTRYSSKVVSESKLKTATFTSEENPCNSHKASWSKTKRIELFLLTGIILVVSFLFVTPTILYALPPLSGIQSVSLFSGPQYYFQSPN